MPNDFLPVHDWRVLAFVAASVVVLLWDVILAAQISKARRQRRVFLALTAASGLLVVPALVIALATNSLLTGRATYHVAWLWPATLGLFVLQSGYALLRRLVTPLLALPIFLLNLSLFLATAVRHLGGFVSDVPPVLDGAPGAVSGTLALIFGRSALWSPLAVQLPLLAPAYPARWRVSRTFRAVVALSATAWVVTLAADYPRAVRAAASFRAFAGEPMQERPLRDFAIGLRILPTLRGAPPPHALRSDLALADTLDAKIVSVVVAPEGVHPLPLDSLASALDDLRRDSVLVMITLGWGRRDREEFRVSPERYRDRRLAMIDQIVRRVRPDVLLPALDPMDAGVAALGDVSLAWWRDYIVRAARLAHRLRPRTRVGVAASSFTPDDSALYAWAARENALDLTGFSLAPSYGGGASLRARMRVAERWMRQSSREQWIFAARGYPRAFGEANQERGIWGTLAWATTQQRVKALVVDGAGDYEALVGLRAPGGRLRPVVSMVDRARVALEESGR